MSDRKRAEEQVKASLLEKEVLLKEIHHRVKNNMQIISSLLDLQSLHMQGKSPAEVFRECQNRIHSMALIHETLYRSQDLAHIDFPGYVNKLVERLTYFHELGGDRKKTSIEGRDVFLDIHLAIPCGLIINELVSNSLKYAFPDNRSGEVLISILESEGRYTMRVKDNGIGLPEGMDWRKTPTLGLKLVVMLVEQLRGSIACHIDSGTEFIVEF